MNQDLINQGVIITALGESLIENAAISGVSLKLKQFSIGDGGSDNFNPTYETLKALTAIPGEWDKRNLIDVYNNPDGAGYIAEGLVPHDVGEGKYCRIAGYWTIDNKLFAVHLIPAWQKPANSGNLLIELPLKAYFVTSDQVQITLHIDPSLVAATREYVDKKTVRFPHKLTRNPVGHICSGLSQREVVIFDQGQSASITLNAAKLQIGDVIEVRKRKKSGRIDILGTVNIDVPDGVAELNHWLPDGKAGTLIFECVGVNQLQYVGGY
ncbi:phage tail protein [Shewanella sp. SW36]|uniref:phage tail protein n=1 Tax=unclassified Shewanella TaxID=196818 RepID=UPI0021DB2CEB|nr:MULTISPECIES: phage tail protein [unclassified Shewanella]MCU7974872.1 phage tail protein [Shewanella sp. SW36]MCU7990261.1 phage tail protein [Shewanella sp. SW1]MCU8052719.1 phage tail protein [Shewanella sp. SM43]